MFNKAKKEKDTYGIVGLGRFGYALAMELATSGADLVALDRDEEKVRELRDYTENAYVVKSLDKKSLSETGIQNCDVAVVCIGEQMDHIHSDHAESGQSGSTGSNRKGDES